MMRWSGGFLSNSKTFTAVSIVHALMYCRKSWAEKKAAGALGFKVNKAALTLDAGLLRLAEQKYDAAMKAKGPGKGQDKLSCISFHFQS